MTKPLPRADLTEILSLCRAEFQALDEACVVITGHTGFVGSWLFESLATAIDAMSLRTTLLGISRSRTDFTRCAKHITPGSLNGWQSAIGTDIRDLVLPDGTTHVIHCASAGKPDEDPVSVAAMIREGTKRVSHECDRVNAKRLLLVSSGSVYRPHAGGWYTESDPLRDWSDRANAPIGAAKAYAERYCQISATPVVIARGFAMIGPRLGPQFAASQFMADALANRPIAVQAPDTHRSYLYAADMAVWLWYLLVHGADGQAYNVAGSTANELYLWSLADMIGRTVEQPVQAGMMPPAPRFVGDNRRARAIGCPQPIGVFNAANRWLAWERDQARSSSMGCARCGRMYYGYSGCPECGADA